MKSNTSIYSNSSVKIKMREINNVIFNSGMEISSQAVRHFLILDTEQVVLSESSKYHWVLGNQIPTSDQTDLHNKNNTQDSNLTKHIHKVIYQLWRLKYCTAPFVKYINS